MMQGILVMTESIFRVSHMSPRQVVRIWPQWRWPCRSIYCSLSFLCVGQSALFSSWVEGLGCVIVTSAKSVEKSLSVTTRSIRPMGGRKPGLGGAREAIGISWDTGRWAERIIDAMHWFSAVCRVSHSLPLLHFKRWSPSGSMSAPHMQVWGM